VFCGVFSCAARAVPPGLKTKANQVLDAWRCIEMARPVGGMVCRRALFSNPPAGIGLRGHLVQRLKHLQRLVGFIFAIDELLGKRRATFTCKPLSMPRMWLSIGPHKCPGLGVVI
jgi:hypothetical protein